MIKPIAQQMAVLDRMLIQRQHYWVLSFSNCIFWLTC